METLLNGLRAAAEATRLRILALCAGDELTVTDLTQILGQSQPRVSRHLKLLVDAGLLIRYREGNWTFYRVAPSGEAGAVARRIVAMISEDDPIRLLDAERMRDIRRQRAEAAARYFERNAGHWDAIRSLHVDEAKVEQALLGRVPPETFRSLADIGTGTGRILELLAPRVEHAVGIDLSREMLAVARDRLGFAARLNCSLRHGDMYNLPLPSRSVDLVTVHQVLHYASTPDRVLAEAARILRPGGRLVVVDFARHDLEYLREEHAHRRLGFGEEEVQQWLDAAGLACTDVQRLAGDPLTVVIWTADAPAETGTPRIDDLARSARVTA
jgi:ubiquinone/menaquinone biosynthesis C-methylase UbiE